MPWILVSPLTSARPHLLTDILVGGTNLRVCLVTLEGGGKFEITQSKYRLTEEQKQEDGQKLFDFCAECLKTFIDSNIDGGIIQKDSILPLGFTVGVELRKLVLCHKSDRSVLVLLPLSVSVTIEPTPES